MRMTDCVDSTWTNWLEPRMLVGRALHTDLSKSTGDDRLDDGTTLVVQEMNFIDDEQLDFL